VKVGDLVWVKGRPRDGWGKFLGIIVKISGWSYRVYAPDTGSEYILDKLDLEALDV
jgi:hypothetical protein